MDDGVSKMVKMSQELMDLLREWHTVPVATVGKDGNPNVAGKNIMFRDDETILWPELYFMQTYENLKQNPIASICVWGKKPPYPAYKIKGSIELYEEEELADFVHESWRRGHEKAGVALPKHKEGKKAAVVFSVEEIYDQTPSPEAGGKKIS